MRSWCVLLLVLGTACRPAVSRGLLVDPVQFHRLTPGGQPVQHSGLALATRTVLTDAGRFEALWREAFASAASPEAPPAVDWSREKVVFVALGERPSGGYGIAVTSVQRVGGELLIEIESTSPGNCPSAAVMSQPVDVVSIPSIPRTDAQVIIRFVERERVATCP